MADSTQSPVAAVAEKPIPVPDNRLARDLIDYNLLIDSDLDAFLLDNFPRVEKRISRGMDRVEKVNLLLRNHTAEAVVRKLRQWCSSYRDLPQDSTPPPPVALACKPIERTDISTEIRYAIVITATISEINRETLISMVQHLRGISQDIKLTLSAIKNGSVILIFNGSLSGFNRINDSYKKRKLTSISNYTITDLRVLSKDTLDETLETLDGPASSARKKPPSQRPPSRPYQPLLEPVEYDLRTTLRNMFEEPMDGGSVLVLIICIVMILGITFFLFPHWQAILPLIFVIIVVALLIFARNI